MKIVDHLPAPVSFVALVIGLGGSRLSWSDPQSSFTSIGWFAIVLGFAALCASIWLTVRQHRELDNWRAVSAIACVEAALAVRYLTTPFYFLANDQREPVGLGLVHDFWSDKDNYINVMEIDIRTDVDKYWMDAKGGKTWADYLRHFALAGADRIDSVLQVYAAYLDAPLIERLSRLRRSEFLYRLQHLDEHVSMNVDVKRLTFPFPEASGEASPHTYGFQEFWKTVAEIEAALAKTVDASKLRRQF